MDRANEFDIGIDDSIIIRRKYWKFDIVFLRVLFFIIIVFDVIYL